MSVSDNNIIDYFFSGNRLMKYRIKRCEDSNIINYLNNRYTDSLSIEETIFRIYKSIDVHPLCPICNKPVKYLCPKNGFLKTCGNKECIKEYKKINSSFNKKETQEKVKKTILSKYGVNNPYKIDRIVKKRNTTFKLKANEILEKRYKTNLIKYGVDNIFKNENIKIKIKEDNIKKHNVSWYLQSEEFKIKSQKTCLEKYNKEKYQNTDKFKKQISYIMTSCETLQKRQNTKAERYGNINYNNQLKRCQTMKRNGTYNTSKSEDETYNILKEKYPDVIRQYCSDKYQFNCDFYIPSLDLYIECNYHWTHGGKLFEDTDKDNIKLEQWKSKNTKYYNNAINTWTNLDIRKHNVALINNLNYKIFYNIEDIKKWINI